MNVTCLFLQHHDRHTSLPLYTILPEKHTRGRTVLAIPMTAWHALHGTAMNLYRPHRLTERGCVESVGRLENGFKRGCESASPIREHGGRQR